MGLLGRLSPGETWRNSRLTALRSASRMPALSWPPPSFYMYAVIATGGKQYRVTQNGVLRVARLAAEPGATVEFGEVLLVGEGANVTLGKPLLKGSKVLATVVRHGKGPKVSVIKFRRREHYLRQKAHRQPFTEVKVTDISAG